MKNSIPSSNESSIPEEESFCKEPSDPISHDLWRVNLTLELNALRQILITRNFLYPDEQIIATRRVDTLKKMLFSCE